MSESPASPALRVGVTGAAGMLGWHLRCYLKQFETVSVVSATRETFADPMVLERFVASVDVIAHFAGQNRGDEAEVETTNPVLAKALVDACDKVGVTPHVVYSSTIHIEKDNAYGRSKRAAGEILQEWAGREGAKFTNLVLPHVFGEGTRPFYNSAVATFAYQLANDEDPRIINDANLELVHAQDVARRCLELYESGVSGEQRMAGVTISVSKVLERLRHLAGSYESLVVPDVRCELDLRLFNLYRSYLFPRFYPVNLERHSDQRGDLVEVVKNRNGGQSFFSTTRPGVTRGNHFHYHKIERFLVLNGRARIEVRRLFDNEVHRFDVSGDKPAFIDMPPLHTHNITNTGDSDLLTLFWAHEIFDPANPDTVFEVV